MNICNNNHILIILLLNCNIYVTRNLNIIRHYNVWYYVILINV